MLVGFGRNGREHGHGVVHGHGRFDSFANGGLDATAFGTGNSDRWLRSSSTMQGGCIQQAMKTHQLDLREDGNVNRRARARPAEGARPIPRSPIPGSPQERVDGKAAVPTARQGRKLTDERSSRCATYALPVASDDVSRCPDCNGALQFDPAGPPGAFSDGVLASPIGRCATCGRFWARHPATQHVAQVFNVEYPETD